MGFKISNEAQNDLECIWLYTFDTGSIEQADRYVELIIDEIEYLANKPKIGKDYNSVRNKIFSLKSKITFHFL